MSRSALWRQEGAKKMREKEAEDLFSMAVEEGRNNPSKSLPLWGPDDSFHFHPVLLEKIIKSRYFQKCCRDITDWNKLVDEIYYSVQDLEPWTVGCDRTRQKLLHPCTSANDEYIEFIGINRGQPSNAFCLLLRLLTLRCSEKQMRLLLDHVDSPYIRGIGLLYLRYAGEPTTIWGWIESYLSDDEPIKVAATSSKNMARQGNQQTSETIGDFVRRLFSSERDYYGTMLPRLPIQVERDLQAKLLFTEKIQERAKKHILNRKSMDYFKTLGSRVMALYGDDDNPITWYEGVIDQVVLRDEGSSRQLTVPKFVVTFPEYGNTETVTLGEMEMLGVALDSAGKEKPAREERRGYGSSHPKHGGSDRGYGRGYDRGFDRGGQKDYERRGYSNAGYKDRVDNRRGGNEPRRGYHDGNDHRRRDNEPRRGYHDTDYHDKRDNRSRNVSSTDRHRENRHESANAHISSNRESPSRSTQRLLESGEKKRSATDVAAHQEKKRKLMAKYG